VVTASVVSDANYNGASSAATQFNITKATPSITAAPTATSLTAGDPLSASTLSGGTASVPGTFAWTDGTLVPGATGGYGVTFTPTDTANYNTATTTANVTVNAGSGTTFAGWSGGASLDSNSLNKYAIGGASSLTATDGVQPASTSTGGNLVLTAIVRTDDPKLAVVGEAVTSLVNYAPGGTVSTVNGSSAGIDQTGVPAGCEKQAFSVPQGADSRKFLRLKATLAP
jgi:hypothetical protein